MARLQILELPEGSSDDRPPFILIVDQWTNPFRGYPNEWAATVGAQGVLVFEDTIDIPANDTTAYLDTAATGALPPDAHYEMVISGEPVTWTLPDIARAVDPVHERADIARDTDRLAKWKTEIADALGMDHTRDWDELLQAAAATSAELTRSENARERLRTDRDEARNWARHGYEIGQKHCSWSDRGVAPAWLTEGWPPHIDSCEHLQQAAEYDTAITRVRSLHRPVEYRGGVICVECSAFAGSSTDNAPVAYDQCGTLLALNGDQPAPDA